MIKFAPAGNSDSFYAEGNKATEQAPRWLAARGLDGLEYSCGKGVRVSDGKAALIRAAAEEHGIELSVHAPYFINFASETDEGALKSIGYVLDSLALLKKFGGTRCVFHPAAQGKMERNVAMDLLKKRIDGLLAAVYEAGYSDMILCPETMGKKRQMGTVDEILEIAKADSMLIPCFDFGHINAREGGILKTRDDYARIVEKIFAEIGEERGKRIHIHFSKIQFGAAGEIRHLTFEDEVYGPDFSPLASVLKEYQMEPFIVCESNGTQAEDALEMKKIYLGI